MKHLWRGWHWLHNFIDSQVLSWTQFLKQQLHLNAMGSEQNGRNFADIVKCNFLNEDDSIVFQILLIFLTDPIDINLALVLVMTCRLVGAKPLPEPILTQFNVAYMHHPGLISQHALVNIKSHFEKIEPQRIHVVQLIIEVFLLLAFRHQASLPVPRDTLGCLLAGVVPASFWGQRPEPASGSWARIRAAAAPGHQHDGPLPRNGGSPPKGRLWDSLGLPTPRGQGFQCPTRRAKGKLRT